MNVNEAYASYKYLITTVAHSVLCVTAPDQDLAVLELVYRFNTVGHRGS